VQLDASDNTMAKKILNSEKNQWNYMLTVGNDEMALGMVDVRARGG
jgi:threonyl-tRNA synthetase